MFSLVLVLVLIELKELLLSFLFLFLSFVVQFPPSFVVLEFLVYSLKTPA